VVELLPPAVNPDLGGPGLPPFGVPVGEFAEGGRMGGGGGGGTEEAGRCRDSGDHPAAGPCGSRCRRGEGCGCRWP